MYTDHLRRKGVFRWHYEVGDELYTFLKNEKKKKKLVLRCLMLTVLNLRFANEELGMVLIYKGCKFLNKLWCCVGGRV